MTGETMETQEARMRALMLAAALVLAAAPGVAAGFTVTTPDFAEGGTIGMAQVHTRCQGQNRSPALAWAGEPAGTQSFGVTMYDPDAPAPGGWWHWTVFNIPAGVHGLAANAGAGTPGLLPAGAGEGRNDFGFSHYGGPCPPPGSPPRCAPTRWRRRGSPGSTAGGSAIEPTGDGGYYPTRRSRPLWRVVARNCSRSVKVGRRVSGAYRANLRANSRAFAGSANEMR